MYVCPRRLIIASQGIHNIFVVMPQFLMTGLSSVIFAISEPDAPLLPGHKLPTVRFARNVTLSESETVPVSAKPVGTNSVAIIFRYVLLDRFYAMLRVMTRFQRGRCFGFDRNGSLLATDERTETSIDSVRFRYCTTI